MDLKGKLCKDVGKGIDDNLNRYDFEKFNSHRFSALGYDFFSKRMGDYHLSVCKKDLYPHDIEIIKV